MSDRARYIHTGGSWEMLVFSPWKHRLREVFNILFYELINVDTSQTFISSTHSTWPSRLRASTWDKDIDMEGSAPSVGMVIPNPIYSFSSLSASSHCRGWFTGDIKLETRSLCPKAKWDSRKLRPRRVAPSLWWIGILPGRMVAQIPTYRSLPALCVGASRHAGTQPRTFKEIQSSPRRKEGVDLKGICGQFFHQWLN